MGRRPVLAVGVLLALVLQAAVPFTALVLPDKPHRLGWQMYSGVGDNNVVVTDERGAVIDVPWEDVLARSRRPELDWTKRLPEDLCVRLGEQQVTVQFGVESRTVTC